MSLRFCGCTLDVEARRLFRGADEVHLSPKAFETLRALVENRPRAMSKAELLRRVWPDVIVSEVSLARVDQRNSRDVGRRPTGPDSPHGSFTRLRVRGRDRRQWFQVSGPGVYEGIESGWLISATRTLPLLRRGADHRPGSGARNLSRFAQSVHGATRESISRALRQRLKISNSKNGTFVENARVQVPTALHHGDEIRIGRFKFVFQLEESIGSTETEI